MFDKDHVLRHDARKEMLKYYQRIGQATLGDLDIYIPNKLNIDAEIDTNNHNFDESRCDPNIIFEGTQPDKQTVRNMRHYKHCKDLKGTIGSFCFQKELSGENMTRVHDDISDNDSNIMNFSPTDLVRLNTQKAMNDKSNAFVESKAQLDMLSYTYPFHMNKNPSLRPADCRFQTNNSKCTFVNEINEKLNQFHIRFPLFQLRYNYHDCNHRKSCFKKGCECRFHLPKQHLFIAEIFIDDDNSVEWHFIDGSKTKISRYQYMAKRNSGDEFMNMSNDIASLVLGCNTNIGTADRSGFYYVTMYASKQNQNEEKIAFLTVCEALSRRVKYQEEKMRIESENNNVSFEPNFAEGFRRLMSAMFAHSSNLVKSSTLSHFLLLYKQRFRFSHDSSTIPTRHLLDWYDGDKELYFRIRKISKDEEGSICHIPEYYINNHIYRHVDLEDYSVYELAMHFDIKKLLVH